MNQSILQALVQSLDEREAVALVSVTDANGAYAGTVGRHLLVWLSDEREPIGDLGLGELNDHIIYDVRRTLLDREHRHLTFTRPEGEVKVFVDVQVQPPHLIIVGAGHIAVPLASIAATCDFAVTVLDDRPQYAHPARFPTAQRVIAGPFRPELAALRGTTGFDKHTYIVLVTRGHQHDVDCLVEVLDDPMAYIGMIGSRRKVHIIRKGFLEEGIATEADFARVYSPVGLDIGALTIEEIAVSIASQLVAVRRHHAGAAKPLAEFVSS